MGLSEEKEEKINRKIEEGGTVDLLEAEEEIERDAVKEREETLKEELEKMRHKKLCLCTRCSMRCRSRMKHF